MLGGLGWPAMSFGFFLGMKYYTVILGDFMFHEPRNKDPYQATRIQWKVRPCFFLWLSWFFFLEKAREFNQFYLSPVVSKIYCLFLSYLGRWSNLTSIVVPMGWFNHQLVNILGIPRVFPGLKWGQTNPSNSKQWKFETSKDSKSWRVWAC